MKITYIVLTTFALTLSSTLAARAEMNPNNPGHFTNTFQLPNNPQNQTFLSGNNADSPAQYTHKNRYQRPPRGRNQTKDTKADDRTQSQDTLSEQRTKKQRRPYQNRQTGARSNAQTQNVNGGMND